MKTTLHIPTEEYGFVEIEVEADSIEGALAKYSEAAQARGGGEGLNVREWAEVRDNFLNNDGEIDLEIWERMSKLQRWFINEIKKVIRKNNHEQRGDQE